MRISQSVPYALSALAAAASLAACSGGDGSQSSRYAPAEGSILVGAHLPNLRSPFTGNASVGSAIPHRDYHKSWVSPDLKKVPRVLFISDYLVDDVYIFTMPAMALEGTLTGFDGPQGMCTDPTGNIWITNTKAEQVLQYSRTGTLLKTLSDPGYDPAGCAVNKMNGDLAVTNKFSGSSGPGNVTVYANGSGSGTAITNPNQYEYYFAAYDTNGNLYVDGYSQSFYPILTECPSGSGSCHTLNVSGGTVYAPGGLNWDRVNNDLVAGDQDCGGQFASCLYQMTVSSSTATITGQTILNNYNGGACDVIQGTLLTRFSRYFAGPCISDGSGSSSAGRWRYPAGGNPTNYSLAAEYYPTGSAISNK
jgi:hypothetical protein